MQPARLLVFRIVALLLSSCAFAHAGAADLFVGNFVSGDQSVKRYNGSTGASLGDFIANSNAPGALSFPLGGAFGPDGNFYVSSSDNDQVLRYNGKTGAFINAFANSASGLSDPAGLVFHKGSLYVASSSSPGAVLRYNASNGQFQGDFVAPGSAGLTDPEGLTFGPDGNLYVTTDGGSVLRFDGTTGAPIGTGVFVAQNSGGLQSARGVAFGADGNLYVSNFAPGGGVLRYNGSTGAFIDAFVPGNTLGMPRPIVFGPDGNLYVGDFSGGSVDRFNGKTGASMGAFVAANSGNLVGPTFLVFGATVVPEPQMVIFLMIGAGVLWLIAWRRRHVVPPAVC